MNQIDKEINELNKSYSNLFGSDDNDNQEGEEDRETLEEGEEEPQKNEAHIWLSFIDMVSDITKISWDKIWDLGIIEFLNYAAYAKEKFNRQKEQIKRWKAKN